MELNSRKISVVCWIYIVVAQWNNRPPVDMSLYSAILSWSRPNQYLPFLYDAVFLAK
jgi:hypothetical protein